MTFPDEDAEYREEREYDAESIEPVVACPHKVDNVHPVEEMAGVEIQQASLAAVPTEGFEDLSVAADILDGREVDEDVRMLVGPASREVYQEALERE